MKAALSHGGLSPTAAQTDDCVGGSPLRDGIFCVALKLLPVHFIAI